MVPYFKTVRVTAFFAGAALVTLLLLSAPMAEAKQKAEKDDSWGDWKGLSSGFVGRRKEPPMADLSASERRLIKREAKALRRAKKAEKRGKLRNQRQSDSVEGTVNAVWLNTQGEGFYGASIADLSAILGKPSHSVRGKAVKGELVLRNAGQPRSWYFDESKDMILFAANTYDTFYSDTNATRLNLAGKKAIKKKQALPMEVVTGYSESNATRFNLAGKKAINKIQALPVEAVTGVPTPVTGQPTPFRETLKFEEEPDFSFSVWATAAEPDADYWYWDYLWGGFQPQLDIPLNIPSPAYSGLAQLRVKLLGSTNLYAGDEHQVAAEINGVPLGSITWDGLQGRELLAEFDQSYLDPAGNNVLKLSSSSIAGPHAIQLLDQIEIDYDRQPVAVGDSLWMRNLAAGTQMVSGFTSGEIFVIESPSGQARIRKDISIVPDSSGGWSVVFDGTAEEYLLVSQAAIKMVDSGSPDESAVVASELTLAADYASSLTKRENSVDYLIIAPHDLTATAEALQIYRRGRFANAKIVWLKDIYDEFSFGRVDPSAIGKFMTWASKKWNQAPSHVVLLGKGTLDQKDRMGYGDSLMPVLLSSTPWTATASDDKLLAVGEQGRFAVGRLPITSDEEGLTYIDKLIAYESSVPGVERFDAVVVADNPDDAGDFHTNSDLLAENLVNNLGFNQVAELYHPRDMVRDQLIDPTTWEVGYVTYDGHGSITQFGTGSESFLTVTDAEALSNSSRPIFTALSCAVGDDSYPGYRSLASALVLNPVGGAIASMAPTGLSLDADAQLLGGAFVDNLFAGANTIGDAVRGAKLQTQSEMSAFMPDIYSVIGDPAVYAR